MQLNADQVRFFHVNGFLALEEPVADPTELERIRGVYDRLFASDAGRSEGDQFDLAGGAGEGEGAAMPQILRPDKYAPELRGRFLGVVDAIARQLLGAQVRTQIFHAILKPANGTTPTPWHQDEAYWDPAYQYQSMSVWMPLQDTTLDHGCMCFNRGSHEWDVLEHRGIGGKNGAHGLEMVDTGVIDDRVACPLPAGGIVIHRNRTAHHAGANRTDEPRRALIMEAALPTRPYPTARRFEWQDRQR